MTEEEKKEYEELKSLLYKDSLTQYGKRKLIGIIEKQQKEIERLKNICPITNTSGIKCELKEKGNKYRMFL